VNLKPRPYWGRGGLQSSLASDSANPPIALEGGASTSLASDSLIKLSELEAPPLLGQGTL